MAGLERRAQRTALDGWSVASGAMLALAMTAACGDDSGSPGSGGSGGLGGAGATGGVGGDGAGGCSPSCDDDNPCTEDACEDGACTYISLNGTDAVTDPDLSDCVAPTCDDGTLVEMPVEGACAVSPTSAGTCQAGVCSCAGVDGEPRFVDAELGTDDPEFGGGTGACAYRTITYALAQAAGEIRVAPGVYDAGHGESFPLAIGGGQSVVCTSDADVPAMITGSGEQATFTTVIELTGPGSGLRDCTVVGTNAPTYCIDIVGIGEPDAFLAVVNNDISSCFNAIRGSGGFRTMVGNRIHDNDNIGLFFSSSTLSNIEDNVFENNAGGDIVCNQPSETTTGSGNVGDDGAPSCAGCQGCPFVR